MAHPPRVAADPIHAEVFGGVNGVSFASAAFDPVTTPGFVQSQFSNLMPGLLAVGGWLGGDAMLLRVNPLLGGVAAPALVTLANLVNLSADYLHNLRGSCA
jgi:hypothetical protein